MCSCGKKSEPTGGSSRKKIDEDFRGQKLSEVCTQRRSSVGGQIWADAILNRFRYQKHEINAGRTVHDLYLYTRSGRILGKYFPSRFNMVGFLGGKQLSAACRLLGSAVWVEFKALDQDVRRPISGNWSDWLVVWRPAGCGPGIGFGTGEKLDYGFFFFFFS